MKFCTECGKPIDSDDIVCDACRAQSAGADFWENPESPVEDPYADLRYSETYDDPVVKAPVEEPVVEEKKEEVRTAPVDANTGDYHRFVQENNFRKLRPDEPSHGSDFLAFLYPITGFVMYFAQRKAAPKMAGRVCMWSWLGIAARIIFILLYSAIWALAFIYIIENADFLSILDEIDWEAVIRDTVPPKFLELNLAAYRAGREAAALA